MKWLYEILLYALMMGALILVIKGSWQALPMAILAVAVSLKERNVD